MEYTRSEAKAWAAESLKGFYDAPLTAFRDDFELDEAQIRENVEHYIAAGVDGMVVGGFIAEIWNTTYQDWLRYHSIMADAVAGRVPLWTIILESSAKQSLEKLAFVEKLGYQGAEIMNPSVQLRSDEEIADYFQYVTDRTDLAMVLYRTPTPGTLMSMELCKRLADIDTMVGVKQGSFIREETLAMRRDIRDDFIICEPVEQFFLDELRDGGQVLWAVCVLIAFGDKRHLLRQYYQEAVRGDWDKAQQTFDSLQPVRDFFNELAAAMAKTGTYASHLAMMKPWMEAIGVKVGPVLPPVRPVAAERAEWLVSKLKELGVA